ncbi:MAG: hypothetical protein ACNA7J_15065, partial [Wenzhouxiangella sp.]
MKASAMIPVLLVLALTHAAPSMAECELEDDKAREAYSFELTDHAGAVLATGLMCIESPADEGAGQPRQLEGFWKIEQRLEDSSNLPIGDAGDLRAEVLRHP